jgi:hypothetical protein
MAHIEVWHRCPVCKKPFDTVTEAMRCRNAHTIPEETWAVGRGGKAVRVFENAAPDSMYGLNWALMEADLSDFTEERKRQLAERKNLR